MRSNIGKRLFWRAGWLVALAVNVLCGCHRQDSIPPRREGFPVMGTYASVMAGSGEQGRATEYVEVARRIMGDIEAEMSFFRPESELSRLNAAAGEAPMAVGVDLRAVLDLAKRYGDLSGGAFDVTVGPLVRLWGFNGGQLPAQSPTKTQVDALRSIVDYRRNRMAPTGALLERKGMRVDLGGIAKGYAVDRCCEALLQRGASNVVVDLGGNMRCYGQATPGKAWRVGVRDPFNKDAILGTLALTRGMAVSTSGHYERFVTIQGKHYAHIIDPRTGCPVEGMAGVTVVAPSAADADALSTALFVLGKEEGPRALARVAGGEALFVPDRQPIEIWVTPGLLRCFEPTPELAARVRRLDR